jgi:hypothetical protein
MYMEELRKITEGWNNRAGSSQMRISSSTAPKNVDNVFSFVIAATGQELSIDSIDLLESLHLHNTSHQGVTETPGPQRLKPAYSLQGEYSLLSKARTCWGVFLNILISNLSLAHYCL